MEIATGTKGHHAHSIVSSPVPSHPLPFPSHPHQSFEESTTKYRYNPYISQIIQRIDHKIDTIHTISHASLFQKSKKKEKKSPTAAVCRSPTGLLDGRPHFTARRGAARCCWSCSSPRRPSPAGSCSPATELLAGRAERLTRRGAPRQPRGAARRCSPPGGPARRRVEL